MSREFQVTFDCADPAALAAFWAEALDYELQPPPGDFPSWDEALTAFGVPEDQWNSRSAILPVDGEDGPRVFFQRVPEGRTVKNRVHLDVRVVPGLAGDGRMAALEVEADRLVALGATRAYRVEPSPPLEAGFITLHDPEGNEPLPRLTSKPVVARVVPITRSRGRHDDIHPRGDHPGGLAARAVRVRRWRRRQ